MKFQVSEPWTFKTSFPCGIFESGDVYKYLPAKPRCPAKKVELLLALHLCPPITNQKRAETAGDLSNSLRLNAICLELILFFHC